MAVLQKHLQTLLIVYLHFMHPHVFHGNNWVVEKQMFQAKQNVVQDQELAVMLLRNLQMLNHLLGSWNVQTVALHTSCVQFWWLQVQCFAIKHCRFGGITNQFYCGIHAWTGLCTGIPSATPANMLG